MDPLQADTLVKRSQQGDREAFRHLFESYYRPLRIVIAVRSPDEDLTDEVVQEAFVTAFERLATYEPRGLFFPWLVGIARNRLANALRARSAIGRLDDQLHERLVARPDEMVGDEPERGARLLRCLEGLAPAARSLAQWRFAERRSVSAISAELGRSAASVSVSLHRIRTALHACMQRAGTHA